MMISLLLERKRTTGETSVVSCRMPNDVLKQLVKYLLVLEEPEMSYFEMH